MQLTRHQNLGRSRVYSRQYLLCEWYPQAKFDLLQTSSYCLYVINASEIRNRTFSSIRIPESPHWILTWKLVFSSWWPHTHKSKSSRPHSSSLPLIPIILSSIHLHSIRLTRTETQKRYHFSVRRSAKWYSKNSSPANLHLVPHQQARPARRAKAFVTPEFHLETSHTRIW
jgi:hypothetical protein